MPLKDPEEKLVLADLCSSAITLGGGSNVIEHIINIATSRIVMLTKKVEEYGSALKCRQESAECTERALARVATLKELLKEVSKTANTKNRGNWGRAIKIILERMDDPRCTVKVTASNVHIYWSDALIDAQVLKNNE